MIDTYYSKGNNKGITARVAFIAALVMMFITILAGSSAYAASVKTSNVHYPTFRTQSSFDVKGSVTSTSQITKAKVGVVNAVTGKWVISKTRTINAKTLKLSGYDSYLKFSSVKPGVYYYRCTVYYKSGKYQRAFNRLFCVYSIKKSGIKVPEKVSFGEAVSLSGTVDFKPVIEKLELVITDSNGNAIENHSAEIDINKSKLDLSGVTHEALVTEDILPGTYHIRGSVKIRKYSLKIFDLKFNVDNTVKTELNSVAMPKDVTTGNGFTVKGTVNCNAKMDSLKLGIKNSNDKWVSSKTVTVNKNAYDLSKLDNNIKFKNLAAGKYRYVCTVKAYGKWITAFDNSFRVMKITKSGITHPDILVTGESFDAAGTVKSDTSMSSIKVGVMNDGKWVEDCYATYSKAVKEYDIAKNANSKIKFGTLPNGKYTYVFKATILDAEKKVFEYSFEVTDEVVIKTSNVLYPPERLGVGKSFSIGGKITSTAKMTRVKVGITDESGNWKVYKDFTPKAKTFNIADADRYITFGSMPTGVYYYRIDVTVGTKAYEKVVCRSYTVAQVTTPIAKSTVSSRIEQLYENLDGKYFTTDGKKANSSIDDRCNVDNVLQKNTVIRNLIKKYKKDGYMPVSMSLLPLHYGLDYGTTLTRGWSCCGFANFAGWYIFADSCNDDVSTVIIQKKVACNYTNAQKYLKPGDIIRIVGSWSSGHSAIVISVKSSGIEILDANSSYYDPVGDRHASRICRYTLGYSKVDNMSVSRATNSPYL